MVDLPIIIGVVAGISVCLFIEKPKMFVHSFILFGTIFSGNNYKYCK